MIDRKRLEFYNVSELSAHYKVTSQTIYNWLRAGWIPSGRDAFNNYIVRRDKVQEIDRVGSEWYPHLPIWKRPEAVFKRREMFKQIEDSGGIY